MNSDTMPEALSPFLALPAELRIRKRRYVLISNRDELCSVVIDDMEVYKFREALAADTVAPSNSIPSEVQSTPVLSGPYFKDDIHHNNMGSPHYTI